MRIGTTLLAALLFGALPVSAHSQYYPPGYGGYGWYGWGGGYGGYGAGSIPAGMGMFAAGVGQEAAGFGQRNLENAQARSINAQTAMGVNEYMWESQQQNNALYWQRQARNLQRNVADWNEIRQRILNNPNEDDINNGSTLNALFDEITNPKVYPRTLQLAQQPIRSALIKKLPFKSASGGYTYSLEQLTQREDIPAIYKRPEVAKPFAALKPIIVELRTESEDGKPPKAATIKKFRGQLDQVKAAIEGLGLSQPETFEAEKYLKALYGLAKMIESPTLDIYLAAVDDEPSAPLGELLVFMHAFNLRFGAANEPELREGYSQLYTMMSDLRQAASVPPDAVYNAATAPPRPNDNRVTNFFSKMKYQHLGAGGPPPAPKPQ